MQNAPEAAAFYEAVFGWNVDGDPAEPRFEDGTGHVIGHFVTDLPSPARLAYARISMWSTSTTRFRASPSTAARLIVRRMRKATSGLRRFAILPGTSSAFGSTADATDA